MAYTLPRPSGSVWEETLLEHLTQHTEAERELLASYADFACDGPEHVRYLVGLILDDEARHHRLFQEMVNKLEGDIEFRDIEPRVPHLQRSTDREKLLGETGRFIEFEKQDLKDLKALERELKPVRRTMLFSLLVRLMELDTKKHLAILEFIGETAKSPWRRRPGL